MIAQGTPGHMKIETTPVEGNAASCNIYYTDEDGVDFRMSAHVGLNQELRDNLAQGRVHYSVWRDAKSLCWRFGEEIWGA